MIYNILAGGPIENLPDLHNYDGDHVCWIGVDRGVFHLLNEGITPTHIFGDFDSVSFHELEIIKENISNFDIYPSEKDETDLELALNWVILQNPSSIRMFGSTGGRLDHMLANIQLLIKPLNEGIGVVIIDHQNELTVKLPGEFTVMRDASFPYISFIPFSNHVDGLTLTGFKYPLKNCHISWGSTLCISNELISNIGTFSFLTGILIMIRSRDKS